MDEIDKDFSFFNLPPKDEARNDGDAETGTSNFVEEEIGSNDEPSASPKPKPKPEDAKSDTSSVSEEFSRGRPGFEGIRYRIREIMATTRYQLAVVVLVITDMVLVIGQLMLDLQHTYVLPSLILHYLSLAVLTLFCFEIVVKILSLGLEFFTHKLEVFDAIVVIVAFVLDIVYLHSSDAHSGLSLIIVLRLWRVVRIQNAMMLQVRRVEEKKVHAERQRRQAVEEDLERCRAYIATLQHKLSANNIPFEAEQRIRSDADIP
ncbi:voltage-gated hydrogen channel 1-like [Macrobrachium rosenbergii]|uniref:voltage-gated hydrogen channel 1-like n=1 Tax=Macrobrachium rosenbergii TaxID=79674 RepID=UPI0034D644EB